MRKAPRTCSSTSRIQPAINDPGSTSIPPTSDATGPDLQVVPAAKWQSAAQRYEAIRPLLELEVSSLAAVKRRAVEVRVHPATLYRWLNAYQIGGTVASLLPQKAGAEVGQRRLSLQVEAIIDTVIADRYLTKQRLSIQRAAQEVLLRCRRAGLNAPHATTVRRRIAHIPEVIQVEKRKGKRTSQQQFGPIIGAFPGADQPLSFIQIDHTPLDLIPVDDLHRLPVGRAWLTLAIDVFSRMVAGFYTSFDPPGALSTGLCLVHAILPKDLWLTKYGISTKWPICGIMDAVHCDNAKEFHGNMLQRACANYGIGLHFRPIKKPQYGGHIERLLGTFATEIHALPGTTFSNPSERGEYDSEKNAALTLTEFERWLADFITGIYHQRPHAALGVPPIYRYEQAMLRADMRSGPSLHSVDQTKLRLDFMPYLKRTVGRTGVVIDTIHYYADILRPWIEAKDPKESSRKREFMVRRDPRDISVVYFYDPDAEQYFRIPYRNTAHAPMSIWELRELRRRLIAEGRRSVDEALIFDAYERMHALEDTARRNTTLARRNEQRKRMHASAEKPMLGTSAVTKTTNANALDEPENIQPFDEIEIVK